MRQCCARIALPRCVADATRTFCFARVLCPSGEPSPSPIASCVKMKIVGNSINFLRQVLILGTIGRYRALAKSEPNEENKPALNTKVRILPELPRDFDVELIVWSLLIGLLSHICTSGGLWFVNRSIVSCPQNKASSWRMSSAMRLSILNVRTILP